MPDNPDTGNVVRSVKELRIFEYAIAMKDLGASVRKTLKTDFTSLREHIKTGLSSIVSYFSSSSKGISTQVDTVGTSITKVKGGLYKLAPILKETIKGLDLSAVGKDVLSSLLGPEARETMLTNLKIVFGKSTEEMKGILSNPTFLLSFESNFKVAIREALRGVDISKDLDIPTKSKIIADALSRATRKGVESVIVAKREAIERRDVEMVRKMAGKKDILGIGEILSSALRGFIAGLRGQQPYPAGGGGGISAALSAAGGAAGPAGAIAGVAFTIGATIGKAILAPFRHIADLLKSTAGRLLELVTMGAVLNAMLGPILTIISDIFDMFMAPFQSVIIPLAYMIASELMELLPSILRSTADMIPALASITEELRPVIEALVDDLKIGFEHTVPIMKAIVEAVERIAPILIDWLNIGGGILEEIMNAAPILIDALERIAEAIIAPEEAFKRTMIDGFAAQLIAVNSIWHTDTVDMLLGKLDKISANTRKQKKSTKISGKGKPLTLTVPAGRVQEAGPLVSATTPNLKFPSVQMPDPRDTVIPLKKSIDLNTAAIYETARPDPFTTDPRLDIGPPILGGSYV